MAQKNKISFTVRIDEDLYRKFLTVASAEGRDVNNHILHLIRTNTAYYERIHGKIDLSKAAPLETNDSEGESETLRK